MHAKSTRTICAVFCFCAYFGVVMSNNTILHKVAEGAYELVLVFGMSWAWKNSGQMSYAEFIPSDYHSIRDRRKGMHNGIRTLLSDEIIVDTISHV